DRNRNMEELKKYKIGVLAGGSSSEREISLKSGKAVFSALQDMGMNTAFIDVNEDDFFSKVDQADIDVAFIALHGKFGEDGTVQRMLAEKNITYTGSGPEASHMALDKLASKERFSEQGLRIPEYKVIRSFEEITREEVWIPCVVKPRSEGSSIGLSVVSSRDELDKAIEKASFYGEDIIIERFIEGREITVGIIDGRALPVVEIIPAGGCYDFDAKYQSEKTRYVVPAEISREASDSAQEAALRAHRALGCEEFSRVDMRLSSEGEIFVLEVNTIPGLTERSLLPMAAKASGLDFQQLCVEILRGAIGRER
ncbi:MAG: D-alanine--D-alanine ligase, partial [Candidatus Omnitrophota bacterium]